MSAPGALKAAVLGRGAREHALALRLAADLGPDAVVVVPGNPGVRGSCGDVPMEALPGELRARGVSLVVIGPEALLAEGVADALRAEGFAVVGPSREAAALETSKAFAKAFLARHGIPTARALTLEPRESLPAKTPWSDGAEAGGVVKYDGLAEGKGVIVCDAWDAVRGAVDELRGRYGREARLLVEERLVGPELSVMLLVSDGEAVLLPESRDHKRLLDHDEGPNTGGMGAFSPVLAPDDPLRARIVEELVAPTVAGLVADGLRYRGFLYIGLMLTSDGPRVLEFNVRFGDPEAQVVLPRIGGSFAELCLRCAEGRLAGASAATLDHHAVGVVLARAGYPAASEGTPVRVADAALAPTEGVHACVAGALRDEPDALTFTRGRALTVVGVGPSRAAARDAAYARVRALHAPGLVHRSDIGVGS